MRFLFLFLIFLITSQARENPFKPIIDSTVLPVSSNQVKKAPKFSDIKVTLPKDARILTSVNIYYQSIDGSINKKTVGIDKSIDWHMPIIISQNPLKAKVLQPSKIKVKKSVEKIPAKTYRPLSFIAFKIFDRKIKIITKDAKIRQFHLSDPFKIVIDFRRKCAFLTKHIKVNAILFKSIDIGNHRGYYRVVIECDAPYHYKISNDTNGFILSVR